MSRTYRNFQFGNPNCRRIKTYRTKKIEAKAADMLKENGFYPPSRVTSAASSSGRVPDAWEDKPIAAYDEWSFDYEWKTQPSYDYGRNVQEQDLWWKRLREREVEYWKRCATARQTDSLVKNLRRFKSVQ